MTQPGVGGNDAGTGGWNPALGPAAVPRPDAVEPVASTDQSDAVDTFAIVDTLDTLDAADRRDPAVQADRSDPAVQTVPAVLAVEVGATRMTAAVVDRSGFVRHSRHRPIPGDTSTALTELVELCASVAAQSSGPLHAVGVALPADVDVEAGIVRHSGELDWHNVPLAAAIAHRLRLPVILDRAVRAAALAEAAYGVASGARDWLYVEIGDQIHAAAVVAGALQRGANGQAGEIGHLPIYPFGLVCRCGQRGCPEPYATATAVRDRYRELTGQAATIAEMARAYGRDPLVDEVFTQAGTAIGLALATYTLIQDPELIVLAGELTGAGGVLLSTVGTALRERLAWRQPPRVSIASAPTPVLHGAAVLAWSAD